MWVNTAPTLCADKLNRDVVLQIFVFSCLRLDLESSDGVLPGG